MHRLQSGLRRTVSRLRSFETVGLVSFGAIAGGLLLLQQLIGEVLEGEHLPLDEAALLFFRVPGNLQQPIGPAWLAHAASDITSLGGVTVLSLVTLLTANYLAIAGKRSLALFVFLSVSSGWLVSTVLKILVGRQRPTLVPHLAEVGDLSFPSGHAMLSAVTYLTLGALLSQGRSRTESAYIVGCAILLTALIGVSRVFLGVHYPSDVAGGWCAGAIWALSCWMVGRWFAFDR